MRKQELVAAIAEKTELTKKDAGALLDATLESIEEALVKGEKIQLIGFGTFEVKERAARTGRNPRNPKETVEIPASKQPVLKFGKSIKDAVNK